MSGGDFANLRRNMIQTLNQIEKIREYYRNRVPFREFCDACKQGDIPRLKEILQSNDREISERDLQSGFNLACLKGHLAIIQLLINHGFNFDSVSICKACRYGRIEIIQLLVNHGVNISASRFEFSVACEKGYFDIVHLLLEYGFDITFSDNGFLHACEKGYTTILQILVEYGFDMSVNSRHVDNISRGFEYACRNGHCEIVQLLLDSGFEIVSSVKGFNKYAWRHFDIIKLLVNRGFDISLGHEAFQEACRRGLVDVAELLINHGIDVFCITPFFAGEICWKGHAGIVELLIDHGFDIPSEEDKRQCLDFACRSLSKKTDVVLVLLENAAHLLTNIRATMKKYPFIEQIVEERFQEIENIPPIILSRFTGRIAKLITDFIIHSESIVTLREVMRKEEN